METIKAKPLNEWTSLEIAVYAVNCPNDDERADEVAKLIESFAAPKWISVKDRLPELTEQVYWYNDDNERVPWEGKFIRHVLGYDPERGIFMARYDGEDWAEVAKFGSSSIINATHWQPLPTPPTLL